MLKELGPWRGLGLEGLQGIKHVRGQLLISTLKQELEE